MAFPLSCRSPRLADVSMASPTTQVFFTHEQRSRELDQPV
jgi:hypothetical protein